VRSCAGYVSGALSSNECPAGSARIETEAACRAVVAAAGRTIPAIYFVQTNEYYPRGCYYDRTTDYVHFNTHAVGAGDPYYQLLCAALATTGAREPNR
jgi:hypothetical protein